MSKAKTKPQPKRKAAVAAPVIPETPREPTIMDRIREHEKEWDVVKREQAEADPAYKYCLSKDGKHWVKVEVQKPDTPKSLGFTLVKCFTWYNFGHHIGGYCRVKGCQWGTPHRFAKHCKPGQTLTEDLRKLLVRHLDEVHNIVPSGDFPGEVPALTDDKGREVHQAPKVTTETAGVPVLAKAAAGSQRATLFGQPVTAVIRWMGSQNWSTDVTRKVLTALGLQTADRTIGTFLYAGRKVARGESTVLGTIPDLPADAVTKLNELAGQHGGAKPAKTGPYPDKKHNEVPETAKPKRSHEERTMAKRTDEERKRAKKLRDDDRPVKKAKKTTKRKGR